MKNTSLKNTLGIPFSAKISWEIEISKPGRDTHRIRIGLGKEDTFKILEEFVKMTIGESKRIQVESDFALGFLRLSCGSCALLVPAVKIAYVFMTKYEQSKESE